jgi:serine/threonine protein phosphatase PrpC
MKFEIIHASCMGMKKDNHPYQDYVIVEDNDNYLIATLSDGLGSSPHASEGARIACMTIADYFKNRLSQPFDANNINEHIVKEWESRIREKSQIIVDFRTTNSFVIVLKTEKRVIVGQIGDSLIVYRMDVNKIQISTPEKDFINETDCLGGKKNQKYELTSHQYNNNLEFLIASDGFGDELISDKMESLFHYLKTKYEKISRKDRNHVLKKEIKQFLNEKNNDDKSVIFVWTK